MNIAKINYLKKIRKRCSEHPKYQRFGSGSGRIRIICPDPDPLQETEDPGTKKKS